MMIGFITFNSSLVPLFQGLCSSYPRESESSGFRRNRNDDLGNYSTTRAREVWGLCSSNPCRFEFSVFCVFPGIDRRPEDWQYRALTNKPSITSKLYTKPCWASAPQISWSNLTTFDFAWMQSPSCARWFALVHRIHAGTGHWGHGFGPAPCASEIPVWTVLLAVKSTPSSLSGMSIGSTTCPGETRGGFLLEPRVGWSQGCLLLLTFRTTFEFLDWLKPSFEHVQCGDLPGCLWRRWWCYSLGPDTIEEDPECGRMWPGQAICYLGWGFFWGLVPTNLFFPPFLLSLYPLVLVRLFVCFFVCC